MTHLKGYVVGIPSISYPGVSIATKALPSPMAFQGLSAGIPTLPQGTKSQTMYDPQHAFKTSITWMTMAWTCRLAHFDGSCINTPVLWPEGKTFLWSWWNTEFTSVVLSSLASTAASLAHFTSTNRFSTLTSHEHSLVLLEWSPYNRAPLSPLSALPTF